MACYHMEGQAGFPSVAAPKEKGFVFGKNGVYYC